MGGGGFSDKDGMRNGGKGCASPLQMWESLCFLCYSVVWFFIYLLFSSILLIRQEHEP